MYLEERIEELEEIIKKLQKEIDYLKAQGTERFLSPTEFAKAIGCSDQLVYKQIKNGEIKTLKGLGSKKVIPMSQFYERESEETDEVQVVQTEKVHVSIRKGNRSIKEAVFA